mmetsp:Transcript_90529/g.210596  ORF Transcript_90529/g.210596 Transcript_90529/m.210596 type:complete len:292 (-) Transcript_90529:966-1841(-)
MLWGQPLEAAIHHSRPCSLPTWPLWLLSLFSHSSSRRDCQRQTLLGSGLRGVPAARRNETVTVLRLREGSVCTIEGADALPVVRCSEIAPAHEAQQRLAGAIFEAPVALGAAEESLRDEPLTLQVVLVAHLEELQELLLVALAHLSQLGVLDKRLARLVARLALLFLLALEELPHPVAVLGVPGLGELGLLHHREAAGVKVYAVKLQRHRRPRDHDAVHYPAELLGLVLAERNHLLGGEEPNAIGLGGVLHVLSDGYVGRDVGGIDLELAAHGTLDGPACVQAQVQLYSVV